MTGEKILPVEQDNEARDAVQDLLDHLGQPSDGKWPRDGDEIDCRVNIGVLRRAREAYRHRLAGSQSVIGTAHFLIDRLDELEWHDGRLEDTLRDFMGHVEPAIERLRQALTTPHQETTDARK